MSDVVVVIRMNTGDDLLAIMRGEMDGRVKVEHPFYVKVGPALTNVIMMPLCPLSDEKYFELDKKQIQFLVTASSDISQKFLSMVYSSELAQPEPESDLINFEDTLLNKSFVKGTDTKH